MSFANPLEELHQILYPDGDAEATPRDLFEWRQTYLRAVWQTNTEAPQSLIVVQSLRPAKKEQVAHALIDVVSDSDRKPTKWVLVVRPLAVAQRKLLRRKGGAWKGHGEIELDEETGAFRIQPERLDFPNTLANLRTAFLEVYARGDPRFDAFMDSLDEIWERIADKKNLPFFTRTRDPKGVMNAVSLEAIDWSSGIRLKGLGLVREPGPTSLFRVPVSWARTLVFKEGGVPGVFYAGMGIGKIYPDWKMRTKKEEDAGDERLAPLGMMVLDALFLDRFVPVQHATGIRAKPWPKTGALLEFFLPPGPHVEGWKVYIHNELRTGQSGPVEDIVLLKSPATDVTGYKIKFLGDGIDRRQLLTATVKGDERTPAEDLSFLFKGNPEDIDDPPGLDDAQAGRRLMDLLTGPAVNITEAVVRVKAALSIPVYAPDTEEIESVDEERKLRLVAESQAVRKSIGRRIFGDETILLTGLEKDGRTEKAVAKTPSASKKKKLRLLNVYEDAVATFAAYRAQALEDVEKEPNSKKAEALIETFLDESQDELEKVLAAKDTADNAGATKKDYVTSIATVRKQLASTVEMMRRGVEKKRKVVAKVVKAREAKAEKMIRTLTRIRTDAEKKEKTIAREGNAFEQRYAAIASLFPSEAEDAPERTKALTTQVNESGQVLDEAKDDLDALVARLGEIEREKEDGEPPFTKEVPTASTARAVTNAREKLRTVRESMGTRATEFLQENLNALAEEEEAMEDAIAAQKNPDVDLVTKKNQLGLFEDSVGLFESELEVAEILSRAASKHNIPAATDPPVDSMKGVLASLQERMEAAKAIPVEEAETEGATEEAKRAAANLAKTERIAKKSKRRAEEKAREAREAKAKAKEDERLRKEAEKEAKRAGIKVTKEEREDEAARAKLRALERVAVERREAIYGKPQPAAESLYARGSPGRIEETHLRRDPDYVGGGGGRAGPDAPNLSKLELEFYGSSEAAMITGRTMSASIRAKDLVPKAVTAGGGRLEQTPFDYYYGTYWTDPFTGFEPSGKVTAWPGNDVRIPGRGTILYHIGTDMVGSLTYNIEAMAAKVPLDSPDFEVMLSPRRRQDEEAPPGSSASPGAIILGLKVSTDGMYPIHTVVYVPRLRM